MSVLIALVLSSGACASQHSTRRSAVLERLSRTSHLGPVKELDRVAVSLRVEPAGVFAHVTRQRFCVEVATETAKHGVEVELPPSDWQRGTGAVLLASGALLLATATVMVGGDERGSDGFGLPLAVLVGGAGTSLVIVGAVRSSRHHTTRHVAVHESIPRSHRLKPCPYSPEPLGLQLISQGARFETTLTAGGRGFIAIDETTWQRHEGKLDVEVLVDDVAVRRVTLTRAGSARQRALAPTTPDVDKEPTWEADDLEWQDDRQ